MGGHGRAWEDEIDSNAVPVRSNSFTSATMARCHNGDPPPSTGVDKGNLKKSSITMQLHEEPNRAASFPVPD